MNQFQNDLFDKEPPPWELDAQDDWLVARVVFPKPPYGPYDYLVPDQLRNLIREGIGSTCRWGRGNRATLAYCIKLLTPTVSTSDPPPNVTKLKSLLDLVDPNPLINNKLLQLANWISEKYMAPLGSVIETVVPPAVRDRAGTREVKFLAIERNL